MNKLKKLKKILKENGIGGISAGPTNVVGTGNIAGAVPGETPPVDLRKRKRIPDFPKLKRNPPKI